MSAEAKLGVMIAVFLLLFAGCVCRHIEAVRAFERGELP